MMREILFTAKRKDNGEWVEGDLLHPDIEINCDYCIEEINKAKRNNCYEIDVETLCQYTGLKDINGKKIFEGDIVKSEYSSNRVVRYGLYDIQCCGCCYDSHQSVGFYLYNPKKGIRYAITQAEDAWDDLEVIGNIFDTPELLEV